MLKYVIKSHIFKFKLLDINTNFVLVGSSINKFKDFMFELKNVIKK